MPNDMSHAPEAAAPGRSDLSVAEALVTLWRGKWIILLATAVVTAITATIVWLLPDKYIAVVVVAPVSSKGSGGMGGLGSLMSQFGGVASSLAGLSMQDDADKAETVAVLQSGVLTMRYIQEQDLLPVLFYKQWDASTKTWKNDDPKRKPTLWKGNEYFKDNVRGVSENRKTGLVTLSISWTDPVVAARWANGLVVLTNDYLRTRAIEQSERHIEYLKKQAEQTDVAQIRSAIYSILESEIKSAMMARGTDEFALRVVDPAAVPERKASPKRLMWTFASAVVAVLLSSFFVLVRRSWSTAA